MINILLVDDHDLVRVGFRHIIEDIKGMTVIGEVASGEDAVKFCRTTRPDVVLMDMSMPGIGGFEATKKILRYDPDIKIIVVSTHTENPFPAKVMKAGAYGYLTKGAGAEEMIKAIQQVYVGQKYLSPDIAQQVALGQLDLKEEDPFEQLSDREMQIMLMLTRGEKVPDIASKLNLTAKTVNTYRYRTFEKLKVNGDVELTHMAIRHKLINPEQL